MPKRTLPKPNLATAGALILFGGLFFYHWFVIATHALDIPVWDEWDVIRPQSPWQWIWGQQGEHRMVPTKLFVSALYRLNGWNFAFHQILNFPIYGLALATLWYLLRQWRPVAPTWLIAVLLAFTLSPRCAEIHLWALPGHYHLVLLFLFGSIAWLFHEADKPQTWSWLAGGTLLGVLCIYSFGNGFSAMAVVTAGFALFKWHRARSHSERKRLEVIKAGVVCGALLLAYAGYCFQLRGVGRDHYPMTLPTSLQFYRFGAVLLANGLGFALNFWASYLSAAFFIVLIFLPWASIAAGRPGRKEPTSSCGIETSGSIGVLVATLAVVASQAGTTSGRAYLGLQSATAGRYTEITMMLIPLVGITWWHWLGEKPRLRMVFLSGYLAFNLIGFYYSWSFMDRYDTWYKLRLEQAKALTVCYRLEQACPCPTLYPDNISMERLQQADAMGYSFMKHVKSGDW